MASAYEIVHRHVEAALAEAERHRVAPETVASNLLADAVRILKAHRSLDDIRSELTFLIENLEDRDYEFMRP
ncbi:MAG TPA: hypothetical protein VKZ87_00690 [Ferrovibrio sp.]|jgi:hypothetical protein|uniref:hypothetical protein n=1 Tax=Ferrovibrio sp. TaxID=1917215 RepID=UPI002B4B3710|nr:hypothetical protein [Ferrovibrio sp.]HLT75873.1 hypothetical protein [Ferrovibrio sp.]